MSFTTDAEPPRRGSVGVAGDDGVAARLARRTARAVAAPAALAVAIAVTGWVTPAWATRGVGTALGLVTVAGALGCCVLWWHRAARWRAAATIAAAWTRAWTAADGDHTEVPFDAVVAPDSSSGSSTLASSEWQQATCGTPRPLHGESGGIPMFRRLRRFPAFVLPLRTVAGPLASGEAVVVHGRADHAQLQPGDRLHVHTAGRRHPIVIARPDDGRVFVADRWTLGIL